MTIVFGVLASVIISTSAHAQMPPPPPRMITVSGEAEEDVAPDRGILSVSLVSRDTDLSKAKRENDEMVERIVAITREFKIPKEKINPSGLNITPEYNYENNKRRFIGYMVNRSLRIIIDDLSIQERVLSAVVDAKVDQVNGMEFTLADPEAHAKAVRVKAVENARERAQALAEAAHAKLGQVLNITTVEMSRPMPYPQPMMMKAESMGGSVAPSLPGMMTLHESVTVSFALE